MNSVRERVLREIVTRLASAIAPTPVLRMPAVPVTREASPALLLFVDGECQELSGDAAAFARTLCAQDRIGPDPALAASADTVSLITALCNAGSLAFADEE